MFVQNIWWRSLLSTRAAGGTGVYPGEEERE
jgi:hypothetical protein